MLPMWAMVYWSCSRTMTLLTTLLARSGCGLTVTSWYGPFGADVAMVLRASEKRVLNMRNEVREVVLNIATFCELR
jgi:hypothetical protein